ncbi:MAG: OsmC family protein [Methylocystaceae bacterium]|nr:OsmC family protein [Methylocystaceae bacterium]
MTTKVKWVEDRLFLGTSASGHGVVMEAKGPDQGSVGPSPMEMLLLGMGGCTTFDVVHILGRMRENVVDCEVEIDSTRADEDPKVYTKIHAHFKVTGHGLKEKKVKQAVEMSAEKYCSASIMLGATAEITHDFEVIDLDG